MSTLAQVTAKVRTALDACTRARRALEEAAGQLGDAAGCLGEALCGVSDGEASQAPQVLSSAANTVAETYRILADAENHARAFLAALGADTVTTGTTGPSTRQASASVRLAPGTPPTPERIEQLRAQLPATVTAGTGKKTHGRWIDADGREHVEVSGKDEKYAEAIKLFKDMKARRIPSRTSDVEMKLAAHMRLKGIRSATLVVNHTPCEGPLGCDALVPVILPNGYTLTVYGPHGFVREYRGGGTSQWLP